MLVLSSSTPPVLELLKDRVSSSSAASSSAFSSVVLRRSFFTRSNSSLLCCCSSKLKLMADAAVPSSSSVSASDSDSYSAAEEDNCKIPLKNDNQNQSLRSRTYLDVRSAEELISGIKRESETGRLPKGVTAAVEELFHYYRNAVLTSGISNADELVLSNMKTMLYFVLMDMEDPFVFPPYHKAIREPIDYYSFGQDYIRPLIDFGNSYVGNITLFHEMEEKLQQGHNIILMSNHQTEADPAVIALLLEKTNSLIAENLIYIAGDRVVTDPLCKPFSMGRNLLCVYSKKHMHDVPELVDAKKRANTRSLKELALLLREGSKIIWIAPSGGRDRPDAVTGEWYPATFDVTSVDNMRRLVEHSGAPEHIYPMALLCYDIMPPPAQVEKEIGEKRVISFHGVGLSVEPEIKYSDISFGCENEIEAKAAYAQALYASVKEQYKVLNAAIYEKQGSGASTMATSLSQPWTS
ncbi:glycerol-3-phosphate acyltransferase, chloroplastic-like [Chenopodium quinoa]|uniref:glycerol-3-phosphate acyltransferase, chloroplastic-like n=1 Tax=Chenopodium quinoa TaxID=63459 RepID=UPI000B788BA2|nr:glycerol-3-phosphate acyltransferase, chloroplastic-like [Chenopodium quinoa]